MMTKKTLVVGLLAMFSVTTFAQTTTKKIKDVRTQPDLYYLRTPTGKFSRTAPCSSAAR